MVRVTDHGPTLRGWSVLWTRYIRPRVWDKPVPVRHANRRKHFGVNDGVVPYDAVLMQQPGDHGIHFIRRQRLRRIIGHGTVNVIVEGCRVRPVTADCFYWIL